MTNDLQPGGGRDDDLVAAYRWTHDLAQRLDRGRADDLTHDALLAALRVGPRGPGLRDWLAAVLRTRSRDLRRAEARRAHRERLAARSEVSGLERSADSELVARLDSALRGLAPSSEEVLRLRFEEELDGAALAARLGCSAGAARQRLSRAVRELRLAMEPSVVRRRSALVPALRAFFDRAHLSTMNTLLASAALLAFTVLGIGSADSVPDRTTAAVPPAADSPHGPGHARCADCHMPKPPRPVPRPTPRPNPGGHGGGRSCTDCHTAKEAIRVMPRPEATEFPLESLVATWGR